MSGGVPADDRGLALGDGLFETILFRDGEPENWEAHVLRLQAGCLVIGLPPPSGEALRLAAAEAIRHSALTQARAAVRLSWTAGSGGRGLDRPEPLQPALVATAAVAAHTAEPARLVTASIRRNETSPASRLKTLAYMDNVLARREARERGGDDALMLNMRGEVACAAAANLFWVEDERLCTPALACGVLDGVVRGVLIARLRGRGLVVEEVAADRERLETAGGAFLTNSLIGVRAIRSLDGRGLEPHRLLDEARACLA